MLNSVKTRAEKAKKSVRFVSLIGHVFVLQTGGMNGGVDDHYLEIYSQRLEKLIEDGRMGDT